MKPITLWSVMLLSSVFVFGVFQASDARAEHTRVTNPNALVAEVLGRGLRYSVGFDRVVSDDFAAGIAIGSTALNFTDGTDANQTAGMIPVYVNYYLTRDHGSVYATVGATIVTNPHDANGLKSSLSAVEFNSSGVLPTFGVGYEDRGDSGFLFRLTAYGIIAKSFAAWGGASFGFAF